jgi:hypothetical protein
MGLDDHEFFASMTAKWKDEAGAGDDRDRFKGVRAVFAVRMSMPSCCWAG